LKLKKMKLTNKHILLSVKPDKTDNNKQQLFL
jgi:hypothetical protein